MELHENEYIASNQSALLQQQQMNHQQQLPVDKMPIKKAFMILGFAFSLSLILLNVVQLVAVPLIRNYLPRIYESSYFIFGISTIPLMIISLPTVMAIASLIPTIKSEYKSKISFGNFMKILVVSYIAMTIINMASLLINSLISQLTGTASVNPLEQVVYSGGIAPTIIFIVILSPIIEEIMFRYVIINKLRGYGSGVAIFASSFIFGLYHGNLFQMFYAFAVGVVLAAIYYKTGKLIYSIILHIAINLIGSVLPLGVASENPTLVIICGIILIAIALSGFILGIITLCKTNFSRLKTDVIPGCYVKPFFLNAGMILYIILILALVSLQFIQL